MVLQLLLVQLLLLPRLWLWRRVRCSRWFLVRGELVCGSQSTMLCLWVAGLHAGVGAG